MLDERRNLFPVVDPLSGRAQRVFSGPNCNQLAKPGAAFAARRAIPRR